MKKIMLLMTILILAGCSSSQERAKNTLLNVSYDPTREFYEEYNTSFVEEWFKQTGEPVTVQQSHGGSGKQARSVIDGLRADVVTLALGYDIDAIASHRNLLPSDWNQTFENKSVPYWSTIVFVVRKGNPKNVNDWNDLIRKDVSVITPNPKTSGGARWNYLGAWSYSVENYPSNNERVSFMKKLYKNVEVLDSGARGSTTTFADRKIGDVLVSWENEAMLIKSKFSEEDYEIIYPSISVKAETPVAVVEKNAKRNGNEELAKAYLQYLYSEIGQKIIVKHHFRSVRDELNKEVNFPTIKMLEIEKDFGGWANVQQKHFADDGIFDQIYYQ